MDITVNGKKVVLRDKLPAREAWPLRQALIKAQQGDVLGFEETTQALQVCIQAWEFDGDPKDVESYAELDMADYAALDTAVGRYLMERFTQPKN